MVRLLILLIVLGVVIWLVTMVVLRFAPGGGRSERGNGDGPSGPHGGWDPPPR